MSQKTSPRLPGRVWFIANLEMVRSKLAAGYGVRNIFEEHKTEAGVSYQQFCRYVRKYVRGLNEHQKTKPAAEPEQTPADQITAPPMPTASDQTAQTAQPPNKAAPASTPTPSGQSDNRPKQKNRFEYNPNQSAESLKKLI